MQASAEIYQLESFLSNFQKFENDVLEKHLTNELFQYRRLFDEFSDVDSKVETILTQTAPFYNVFEVLNIKHYEAWVHTPFLAHLLDPSESHQQGDLFFFSFVQDILAIELKTETIRNISVFEEFSFNDGRIDILITYYESGRKKSLIIENKIYHHDGERQLERYYCFASETMKLRSEDMHIVYLKPYVSKPTTYSINLELYLRLESERCISCIGYVQHIAPWLESILNKIEAESVKQVIAQYIKTIKTL